MIFAAPSFCDPALLDQPRSGVVVGNIGHQESLLVSGGGEVTIDRYVVVDDVGRVINPLICEGQVQGGLAQGIGQALVEHTVYDPHSGQLLSGSLMVTSVRVTLLGLATTIR